MNFKELHHQEQAVHVFNVWDVPSCKIAEETGYPVLGTSSAAIASMLGYDDGENIPFEEVLYIVKRISESTQLPLSVDIETGYSKDPQQIVNHILRLANLNVAGINIEDSSLEATRKLKDPKAFSQIISKIKKSLNALNKDVFINVRTDTYLLNLPDKLQETIRRGQIYEKAGADGLFVPGLTQINDIKAIVEAISLPLNVMCFTNLPTFKQLEEAGVKRISMGNFLFNSVNDHFKHKAASISLEQTFKSLL